MQSTASQHRARPPTPFTREAQGRLSGGGTTKTTGDKRAGMSQVWGYEEHSLTTMVKTLASVTWELSLLSWLRACFPIPPWWPGWGRHERFPESCLSTSPVPGATQPRMAFPTFCLGFIIPFLLSIGSYPFFMGNASETIGPLPPSTLSASTIWIPLGPRAGLGVLRVHEISQRELAGTRPLRAIVISGTGSNRLQISRHHHLQGSLTKRRC